MTLNSEPTKLSIANIIDEDRYTALELYNEDYNEVLCYWLDENELIKLRDHLNKLIEQIKLRDHVFRIDIVVIFAHEVTSKITKKLFKTLLSKCLSTWLCLMGFCV